jgi:hypothetical protein
MSGSFAPSIMNADRWNAGAQLMQADHPEAWHELEAAARSCGPAEVDAPAQAQSFSDDRARGRRQSRSEVAVTRGTPWLQRRGKNVPAASEPRTRSEWLLHGQVSRRPNRIQGCGAIRLTRTRDSPRI